LNEDFHVMPKNDAGWVVKDAETAGRSLGNFKRRALAEAYGRALAHRHGVELVVHMRNGQRVRRLAASLSYCSRLA
jgi:hypothetical protein